jgi:MoaA/NifB/PqqE/SkfB family radical SAM enzyme
MTSKTFCVLPWVHAATLTDGNVQLCCVSGGGSGINLNEYTLADYWNSEYVKDARRSMLAGKEVKACQRCYREEACGYKSHRIVENEVWQKKCGDKTLQQLIGKTAADGTLDAAVQYIDLRLGNTCNLQCVMCQPRESSRWLPTAQKLSELCQDKELKNEWKFKSSIDTSRFEWYRNTAFWSNLKTFLPHVKEIILAGGEPFLIKEQFTFVKACCDMGEARHIRLRYHTNGTIFTEEMIPYWEQFEKVHFFVSLDGIGDVANYVRHPSNWQEIEANIRRFDSLGENTLTNFNFSTHALNIYRIPEVLDWADNSSLRNRKYFCNIQEYVNISLVHYPPYQNIRVLPVDYKQVITEKLGKYMERRMAGQGVDKLTAILNFMNSEDHSKRMASLVEYTKRLDISRDTDFFETFPELAPYWIRYERAGC